MNTYHIELTYGLEATIPMLIVEVDAETLADAKRKALEHGPMVSEAWTGGRCKPIRADEARS